MCRDSGHGPLYMICKWLLKGCAVKTEHLRIGLHAWTMSAPTSKQFKHSIYVKRMSCPMPNAAQCRLFLRMSCLCIAWDEEWDRLGVRCTLRGLGLLAYSVDIITRGGPLRQVCLTIVNICEGYSTAWLIRNLVKILIIFNKLQPDHKHLTT